MRRTKTFIRNLLSFCLVAALVLSLNAGEISAQTTSKEKVSLKITTSRQLRSFFEDLSRGNTYEGKLIKLENDIKVDSYESESWLLPGQSTAFSGTFDGAGHTISGIYKPKSSGGGLFGTITQKGTVRNLTLDDCSFIMGTNGYNEYYYGGAIAYNNQGNIINCRLEKNCSLTGYNYIGGICRSNSGTIRDCSCDITITFVEGESYQYMRDMGGIVYQNSGKIINSSFGGAFLYDNARGGSNLACIASSNSGLIQNCFVYGSQQKGAFALCCNVDDSSVIRNCYYSRDLCGSPYSKYKGKIENVEDISPADMQTEEFVSKLNKGVDASSLKWMLDTETDYPTHVDAYEVTFKSLSSTKGYVKSSMSYAAEGQTVKLTSKINSKYKLSKLAVKTSSGETVNLTKVKTGVYEFTMPDEKVVVTATVKKK